MSTTADLWTVDPATGCWLWDGYVMPNGYGMRGGKLAHRMVYEQYVGEIPAGKDLDHFACDTRRCVNPAHLRPASRRENLLRGDTIASRKAAQTHCVNGHEFTEENIKVRSNGTRRCRECSRLRDRARYSRRYAARKAKRLAEATS